MSDTNPYAPPVPVEEDAASYDLRKIARLYNRLGVVLKWFVFLLVIDVCLWMCMFYIEKFELRHGTMSYIMHEELLYFIPPIHLAVFFLYLYFAFAAIRIARVLQYRNLAWGLIIFGAIFFPGNIIAMIFMRRKAAQILRDAGIEITGGKVDLAKIPVENDY